MQKKSTTLRLGKVLLAASIICFASCKKDKTETTDEDTGFATEQTAFEKTFDDVQDMADQADANNALSTFKVTSTCATVTRDTVSSPRRITIDFGLTNCLCSDGVYRRGKVLVSYNGRYRDSGSVHTISFDSFFVNDNQLTGTKTVANKGRNAAGQLYYNIEVNGALILAKGAGTRSWVSTRTRTWVSGSSTILRGDDVYNITGSGTVTRVDGSTFTANITAPLVLALSCDWISQGTMEITPKSGKVRTLDYGSGTCDALATMIVGSKSYTITLRR